jgi:hypothetical protein
VGNENADAKYDYNSCDGLEHNQFPARSCSVTNGPYAQSKEFHQDVEYRLASEDFLQRSSCCCIATTLFCSRSGTRHFDLPRRNVSFAPLTGGKRAQREKACSFFALVNDIQRATGIALQCGRRSECALDQIGPRRKKPSEPGGSPDRSWGMPGSPMWVGNPRRQ